MIVFALLLLGCSVQAEEKVLGISKADLDPGINPCRNFYLYGGRRFDSNGNLTDWWSEEDVNAYEKRAECFAEQYGNYRSFGFSTLNGYLTRVENIADHGGLRIVYRAFRNSIEKDGLQTIDGFSSDQRFFLAWAQLWCENQTDELTRNRLQNDVHSLGWHRTNGVVGALPEFAEAFSCKPDDPMVQKDPCRVW